MKKIIIAFFVVTNIIALTLGGVWCFNNSNQSSFAEGEEHGRTVMEKFYKHQLDSTRTAAWQEGRNSFEQEFRKQIRREYWIKRDNDKRRLQDSFDQKLVKEIANIQSRYDQDLVYMESKWEKKFLDSKKEMEDSLAKVRLKLINHREKEKRINQKKNNADKMEKHSTTDAQQEKNIDGNRLNKKPPKVSHSTFFGFVFSVLVISAGLMLIIAIGILFQNRFQK